MIWGREMESDLRKWGCIELQISLVLFRFSFRSLLLSEETHQVKEKRRDNPGESVNLTMLMLLNI